MTKTEASWTQPDNFDDLNDIEIYSNEFRQSEIYHKIMDCDLEGLIQCIYQGQNVNFQDEMLGITYLHLIISRASYYTQDFFISMIHALSNAGEQVDTPNAEGKTPVQFAISRNLGLLMVALVRCGASIDGVDLDRVKSFELKRLLRLFSPGLWTAVERNDYMTVSRLISFWCRVRIQRNGLSLIAFARQLGSTSMYIIELLEDKRPTLEFVHATLAGDELRMLEILNNKNIDVKIVDMCGVQLNPNLAVTSPATPHSLRWNAASLGHSHIVHMLPDIPQRPKFNTDTGRGSGEGREVKGDSVSDLESGGCLSANTALSLHNYYQQDSDTCSEYLSSRSKDVASSVCRII